MSVYPAQDMADCAVGEQTPANHRESTPVGKSPHRVRRLQFPRTRSVYVFGGEDGYRWSSRFSVPGKHAQA
jgi:hypothetical protein